MVFSGVHCLIVLATIWIGKLQQPNAKISNYTTNTFIIASFLMVLLFLGAPHNENSAYYSHKTLRQLFAICGLKVIAADYDNYESLSISVSLNRALSNALENIFCIILHQFVEDIVAIVPKNVSLVYVYGHFTCVYVPEARQCSSLISYNAQGHELRFFESPHSRSLFDGEVNESCSLCLC
jgi:hypothetical protein